MTKWDQFFSNKIKHIVANSHSILDIGGGLRAVKGKSNRFDPKRAWIEPLLEGKQYRIIDPVPDYEPDLIGDIHDLPLPDSSEESILCLAVLEHVENPIQAVSEIYRVLRPKGKVLLYVPFLFYYHAEPGYYKDYWRFTNDTIELLFRNFTQVEIQKVRGALETWVHISPLGKISLVKHIARFGDRLFKKTGSNQVSGYYIYAVK